MELRAFATVLRAALERSGLSQRAFAKAVGTTQSAISHYLGGRAPPPLPDLVLWMNALKLPKDLRERFVLLANLSHCPGPIESEFLRQEARLSKLERDVAQLLERAAADRPLPGQAYDGA